MKNIWTGIDLRDYGCAATQGNDSCRVDSRNIRVTFPCAVAASHITELTSPGKGHTTGLTTQGCLSPRDSPTMQGLESGKPITAHPLYALGDP